MLDFFFKVLYKQKFNVFDIGYRIYYTREEVVYKKKKYYLFSPVLGTPENIGNSVFLPSTSKHCKPSVYSRYKFFCSRCEFNIKTFAIDCN